MRWILFPLLGVLMVLELSGDQHPVASAQQTRDPASKLRAIQEQKATLQKQLQDLVRQEQALRKEMEEKNSYIKVEVKGELRKGSVWATTPSDETKGWNITAQLISWNLNLSNNKKLVEAAKACEGKSVKITGTLVGRSPKSRGSTIFLPRPVLVVATLKAAD